MLRHEDLLHAGRRWQKVRQVLLPSEGRGTNANIISKRPSKSCIKSQRASRSLPSQRGTRLTPPTIQKSMPMFKEMRDIINCMSAASCSRQIIPAKRMASTRTIDYPLVSKQTLSLFIYLINVEQLVGRRKLLGLNKFWKHNFAIENQNNDTNELILSTDHSLWFLRREQLGSSSGSHLFAVRSPSQATENNINTTFSWMVSFLGCSYGGLIYPIYSLGCILMRLETSQRTESKDQLIEKSISTYPRQDISNDWKTSRCWSKDVYISLCCNELNEWDTSQKQ